jgi:hypothetical protein
MTISASESPEEVSKKIDSKSSLETTSLILKQVGPVAKKIYVKYVKYSIKWIRFSNHHRFLLTCKNRKLVPNFLKLRKEFELKRANTILRNSENLLLDAFIKDSRNKLFNYRDCANCSRESLKKLISEKQFICLDTALNKKVDRIRLKQLEVHNRKLNNLAPKQCTEERRHSATRPNQDNDDRNSKLVVNLSSVALTDAQCNVLSKGLNYAVAPARVPKFDYIKAVESTAVHLGPEKASEFRVKIKLAIDKHKIKGRNISEEEEEALKQLKENKNIILSKADKGNIVVVQDKKDYTQKLSALVTSDDYSKLASDPTKSIENRVSAAIKKSGDFDERERQKLAPKFTKPPHIYGLVKVHKAGFPLRPIVSSIGSPCQNLAKYLVPILNPLLGKSGTYLKNSEQFVKLINGQLISDGHILVSLDIISLFTTTPVDESLLVVRRRLEEDVKLQHRTHHTVDTIMELLTVCLCNTYFYWNGEFYRQKRGMAMGSSLSPVVSGIFLEELEARALETSVVKPKMLKRYVDDMFAVWPQDQSPVQTFLDHMNKQNPHIQFTLEIEKNNKLPFLDVFVEKVDGRLVTSVYRKPTDSGQYLHYSSNHCKSIKSGIVNTLLHRAETHCTSEESRKREEKEVETILIKNNYPPKLINNVRTRRAQRTEDTSKVQVKPRSTMCIPYVTGLSEKIRRIGNGYGLRTVFSSQDTIRSRLVNFKPRDLKSNKDVVYEIPCECRSIYIGETGRPVEVRVTEHKRSVQTNNPGASKLAEHALNTGHQFRWDDVRVIGHENNWKKRKIHEAAEMIRRKNVISCPSFDLDPLWFPVLRSIPVPSVRSQPKQLPTMITASDEPSQQQIVVNTTTVRRSARLASKAKV